MLSSGVPVSAMTRASSDRVPEATRKRRGACPAHAPAGSRSATRSVWYRWQALGRPSGLALPGEYCEPAAGLGFRFATREAAEPERPAALFGVGRDAVDGRGVLGDASTEILLCRLLEVVVGCQPCQSLLRFTQQGVVTATRTSGELAHPLPALSADFRTKDLVDHGHAGIQVLLGHSDRPPSPCEDSDKSAGNLLVGAVKTSRPPRLEFRPERAAPIIPGSHAFPGLIVVCCLCVDGDRAGERDGERRDGAICEWSGHEGLPGFVSTSGATWPAHGNRPSIRCPATRGGPVLGSVAGGLPPEMPDGFARTGGKGATLQYGKAGSDARRRRAPGASIAGGEEVPSGDRALQAWRAGSG